MLNHSYRLSDMAVKVRILRRFHRSRSLQIFIDLLIEGIRTLMEVLCVQRLFLCIFFFLSLKKKFALGRLELEAACKPNLG